MKRSQMLGVIYNKLYEATDLEEDDLAELSEFLLNTVELAGMTPPFSVSLFDKTHRIGGNGREWEPEDES